MTTKIMPPLKHPTLKIIKQPVFLTTDKKTAKWHNCAL